MPHEILRHYFIDITNTKYIVSSVKKKKVLRAGIKLYFILINILEFY